MVNIDWSSLQSKSKKDVNFNVTDVNLDEGLKTLHSKMEYLRTNIEDFFAKSGGAIILGSSLDDAFTRNLWLHLINLKSIPIW